MYPTQKAIPHIKKNTKRDYNVTMTSDNGYYGGNILRNCDI